MDEAKLYFDLQLFSDDSSNSDSSSDTSNDNANTPTTNNDSAGDDNQNEDYSKYDDNMEDPFPIKDEIARLVLDANNVKPNEENKSDMQDDSSTNTSEADEPNNDTAQNQQADDNSNDTQQATQPTDYKALYEQTQREMAALKEKYGAVDDKNNINQNTYQPPPPTNQISNNGFDLFKNIKITPQIAKAMDEVTTKRALEMTGLTKDDLDALEYAEDNDEKKLAFENAKQLARNSVANYVGNVLVQQQQAKINAQLEREQSIIDTQQFISKIKQQDNYRTLDNYITQQYFTTLSPQEQNVIRGSYQKLNNQCGTLADNMIIKNFWNNGVAAYNKQTKQNQKVNAVNSKMAQRNKMPRVNNVPSAGSNNNEAWTVDRISTAINSGHWQDIPKNIQKEILGS